MAMQDHSLLQAALYLSGAYLAFSVCRAIYNVYFHPLAKIPGPKLRAAFYFPHNFELVAGDVVHNWHKLHEQYGEVVRISPSWISFTNPDAWRDIYAHPSIPKDPVVYNTYEGRNRPANIISSNDADHARIRRCMNHAFSDQALRGQEPIISSYITLLVSKLQAKSRNDSPIDIMRYVNYATFDILGDLCFGESFNALESEEYSEWMANLFKGVKLVPFVRLFKQYPIIGVPFWILTKIFPQILAARTKHDNYTIEKTAKRIEKFTDRKDFMSYILKHNDEKGMTRDEIMRTSGVLIVAGSETSATLLSGAIYYLLSNPTWLEKVREELDGAFKKEEEMTFASLGQLKVLNAVLTETFRMYPPVPVILPRATVDKGAIVCGTFIPKGCTLGVTSYAASRSSHNFKHPDIFAPQRHLGDPEFKHDKRSVIQPFSVGPRNCIGQTMAWLELRAILARVLWNFDIELVDKSHKWDQHKVFVLWDKPALMVRLKMRKHE
ncbi:cytochrome P450 monooxygenase-like protein [Paraphaeosphaeria sporulosa]|uniref:Cytochrome P450 monooxygenase-like protein n=1 Tax=Paraphaeosphaeria sporulosa TaxID=1460663 RepID=A0A177CBA6_9PLEO|nr:cytochrome P450 monooxygenase-like protein [Paraphaeosphaeria sporulosa]OAG04855.1 cytochrome P450 monooxygenase-like protein [Paraphaeosphaeria sporulosa]